jgi:hypothetical protein
MLKILKILWIVELVAMLIISTLFPRFLGFACFDTCGTAEEMTNTLFRVMVLNPFTIVILCIGFFLWIVTLFQLKPISSRVRRNAIIFSFPVIAAMVVGLAVAEIHQMGFLTREDQIGPWISGLFLLYFVASLWPFVMAIAIPFAHNGNPEVPME